jgi:general secretion pathway protein I
LPENIDCLIHFKNRQRIDGNTLFSRDNIVMNERGFTLLEAIVALVLMATAGMALLSWINTNLITLTRVQEAQQRNEAIRSALTFMDTINPLEKPQGEESVGIYQFRWQAQAIELPKDGVSILGDMSLFQVGLYETEVEISLEDRLLSRFTVRQVGFEQVHKYDVGF